MTRIGFSLATLAMVACGGQPSPPVAAPRAAATTVASTTAAPPKLLRALVEIDIAPDVHPPVPMEHCTSPPCISEMPMPAPTYPADTEMVITTLRRQFLACFEGNARGASGVGVVVKVSPNGEVAGVTTHEAYGEPPPAARECASRALKRVTFAPPMGGSADIFLTLHFRPQE
jgi:hypothetical protein